MTNLEYALLVLINLTNIGLSLYAVKQRSEQHRLAVKRLKLAKKAGKGKGK